MANLHTEFFDAVGQFSFDRRVENLPTPETLFASIMRQSGIASNGSEPDVWFDEDLYSYYFHESRVSTVRSLFHESLTTPISKLILDKKMKGDENYRNREYVRPLIPQIAGHIHGARASRNGSPWNPGKWFFEEISYGFSCRSDFEEFFNRFVGALCVGDDDDHLARFLQISLKERFHHRELKGLSDMALRKSDKRSKFKWPVIPLYAEYVSLFNFVFEQKTKTTRYRWIQSLDAVLRMFATVSSVWRLKLPGRVLSLASQDHTGHALFSLSGVIDYGERRINVVDRNIQQYIIDYLTICMVVARNSMLKVDQGLEGFTLELAEHRADFQIARIEALKVLKSYESEFSLNTGTFKNLKEFMYYVGVQKTDYARKSVDYSYHFERLGRDYQVNFGDSLLFTLVQFAGFRLKASSFTSRNFNDLISGLGVDINLTEYSLGNLGRRLMTLGLVEDSSDSDSGLIFTVI